MRFSRRNYVGRNHRVYSIPPRQAKTHLTYQNIGQSPSLTSVKAGD